MNNNRSRGPLAMIGNFERWEITTRLLSMSLECMFFDVRRRLMPINLHGSSGEVLSIPRCYPYLNRQQLFSEEGDASDHVPRVIQQLNQFTLFVIMVRELFDSIPCTYNHGIIPFVNLLSLFCALCPMELHEWKSWWWHSSLIRFNKVLWTRRPFIIY